MKKMLSVAAVALFVAGSSVFADCGSCSAKKAEARKTSCCQAKKVQGECTKGAKSKCTKGAKSERGAKEEAKKCGADCTKPCCAKK
jgi:hypothetical protein